MQQAGVSIVHHGTVELLLVVVLLRDAKRAIYYVNSGISAHLKHHECSSQHHCSLSWTSHAAAAAAAAAAALTSNDARRGQLTRPRHQTVDVRPSIPTLQLVACMLRYHSNQQRHRSSQSGWEEVRDRDESGWMWDGIGDGMTVWLSCEDEWYDAVCSAADVQWQKSSSR